MILWSESAVPWTYRPNDDLVNEILKMSSPAHVTNILGINTDYLEDEVYNSVYCYYPMVKLQDDMIKELLLSFIEKPFAGIIFPFFIE